MDDFIHINEHIAEKKYNIYSGTGAKKTVMMDDGQLYMLKLPNRTRDKADRYIYCYNAISEYIGSHIFQSMGFNVQETYLGIYTCDNGKDRVSCLCRDFSNDGIVLHEAEKVALGLEDIFPWETEQLSLNTARKIVDDVGGFIRGKDDIWKELCDRLVVDVYIGCSRNNMDWGLAEFSDETIDIAPVYACGTAFLPRLQEVELSDDAVSEDTTWFKRMFFDNADFYEALKRVIPRIRLQDAKDIIEQIPYISKERKKFYYNFLEKRYNEILIPAMERRQAGGYRF